MIGHRLEITVNRRRFDNDDGVEPIMTAAKIAALVGIPASNAIVEKEVERGQYVVIYCDQSIEACIGTHFLVTRHFVMGG